MKDEFKRKCLENLSNRWWHCKYDRPAGDGKGKRPIRRAVRHRMSQDLRRILAEEM